MYVFPELDRIHGGCKYVHDLQFEENTPGEHSAWGGNMSLQLILKSSRKRRGNQ